ncbi:unnamed protein product [Somion occarium]|uniref:Uncharacterized protein n=1 Tax=Somion occarium TaxID=3059160 RepID=A0ABP1E7F0_9APHY
MTAGRSYHRLFLTGEIVPRMMHCFYMSCPTLNCCFQGRFTVAFTAPLLPFVPFLFPQPSANIRCTPIFTSDANNKTMYCAALWVTRMFS